MGLFDKIKGAGATALGALKAVGGKVAAKASSIPLLGKVLGSAGKVTSSGIPTAAIMGAAATVISKPSTAIKALPTALKTVSGSPLAGVKKLAQDFVNKKTAVSAAAGGGGAALSQAMKATPTGALGTAIDYAKSHPIVTAVAAAGAAYGIEKGAEALGVRGGAGFIGSAPKKRRKKAKKTKKTYRRKSTKRSRKRGYGTARQYARKGGKDVHYTKKGQPYIIMANGRARFVRKGGR